MFTTDVTKQPVEECQKNKMRQEHIMLQQDRLKIISNYLYITFIIDYS